MTSEAVLPKIALAYLNMYNYAINARPQAMYDHELQSLVVDLLSLVIRFISPGYVCVG